MKILAIDSSGLVASVAITENDVLIAEYTVNHKKTHSQTLMGMLDEIVQMTEQDLSTIDAIAVAGGPGSFTGLRIGSASAKGLAMALEKPIISVPTVDALAYNLWGCGGIVCPIMDARRNQVYTGTYSFEKGFEVIKPQRAMDVGQLCEELDMQTDGRKVIFMGDGVPVYRNAIDGLLHLPHEYAPSNMNRQRAASVAALAQIYYAQGKLQTAKEHAPIYLRLSQAEREKNEREGQC